MTQELSLTELTSEREELRKDLIAWKQSYDILRRRIQESSEQPRNPPLHQWSGSRSVVGSLEMSIHAIERTIEEYGVLINKVKNGEILNTDRPTLALVEDDSE
jgi:transposase